ncbi:uncharacterized protein E0L32_011672 [Thyridium curvatum]|uniref:HTH APSES-type domain-containing protein n=1 Tax=Thyridium curvatum TaxID=1093900 RepID=A0A507BMJ5_9PEZI|nr:uncharacterized protein E0L32_011672 [Thyridium curvatum]TPX18431.1 hypothetical protein E0L32_011672 [Thyridium curvatum]
MPHYNPHQQPPLIQPGSQYANTAPYGQYGYPNGLTSPPTAPQVSNPMAAQNVLPPPGMTGPPNMPGQYGNLDTTGQIAPPGMKPRVTATLWEDEGSLCFQVEARGICVARREDNHMINGTKLLNVAGMTRGRRDGILKSEKVRHVVKIGPMHLKGVWIPFERALEFANKERITDLLYPLFVHNIGALLYHPTNQTRTTQVMAAAERRKQEQSQMRSTQPPAPGLPALQPQHHHSMGLPGPQSSLPSHASMGRPSLDRAHTFPTPPTSASSVMGAGMGASDNFQWSQQGMSGAQGTNPMSIDTNLSNARSMPATPATTPPGSSLQGMQAYPPATQAYDNSRQLYNTPSTQQSPYPQSHNSPQDRSIYGQSAYVKNEMGPPSSRPSVAGPGADQPDSTKTNGMMHGGQAGEPVPHHGEEEAEHEHDAEYTHNSGAYDASRASYNYNPAPVGGMPTDPSHISAEMAGSAAHQAASGRSTPRSAAAPQSYYTQGYQTPPRAQQASSNLYNVMTSDRGAANGGPGDVYAPAADMGGSLQNGYGAPVMNGAGMKRGREDEDDSASGGMGGLDMKRRKMTFDGSVPSPVYDTMSRPASAIAAPRRR